MGSFPWVAAASFPGAQNEHTWTRAAPSDQWIQEWNECPLLYATEILWFFFTPCCCSSELRHRGSTHNSSFLQPNFRLVDRMRQREGERNQADREQIPPLLWKSYFTGWGLGVFEHWLHNADLGINYTVLLILLQLISQAEAKPFPMKLPGGEQNCCIWQADLKEGWEGMIYTYLDPIFGFTQKIISICKTD